MVFYQKRLAKGSAGLPVGDGRVCFLGLEDGKQRVLDNVWMLTEACRPTRSRTMCSGCRYAKGEIPQYRNALFLCLLGVTNPPTL